MITGVAQKSAFMTLLLTLLSSHNAHASLCPNFIKDLFHLKPTQQKVFTMSVYEEAVARNERTPVIDIERPISGEEKVAFLKSLYDQHGVNGHVSRYLKATDGNKARPLFTVLKQINFDAPTSVTRLAMLAHKLMFLAMGPEGSSKDLWIMLKTDQVPEKFSERREKEFQIFSTLHKYFSKHNLLRKTTLSDIAAHKLTGKAAKLIAFNVLSLPITGLPVYIMPLNPSLPPTLKPGQESPKLTKAYVAMMSMRKIFFWSLILVNLGVLAERSFSYVTEQLPNEIHKSNKDN